MFDFVIGLFSVVMFAVTLTLVLLSVGLIASVAEKIYRKLKK